ncbi:MAG: hypothetical protein C4547_00420 [Phycisphaerales bacterium]|nr:MAG: hypothetical protein C4547_00420 [Phycisphaerales bacterium]
MGWKARPWLLRGLGVVMVAAAVVAGAMALDRRVDGMLLSDAPPQFPVIFPGSPPVIANLAKRELLASLTGLRAEPWLETDLCRRMAGAVGTSGWVKVVRNVRRRADGAFEVNCEYRTPVAMVQQPQGYVLVDAERVRLPGVYAYHESWVVIDGVEASPPPAGTVWPGDDLAAGIALVLWLSDEPFARQVTAVLVGNYDGRVDPHRSHVELATDRAGGRIRWGSAPGRELEENSLAAKTAILRANFARTGRLDASYPVIDVATFPDRFTVPG